MKIFLALIIAIVPLFYSHSVFAQHHKHKNDPENHSGQMTIVIKNIPDFKEYPAEPAPDHLASDINFSSDKNAWSFRTRLRAGLKSGPNFNGHYTVVTFGCGTSCQDNFIVDVNNGNVIGGFATTYGSSYHKDSALIIADFPGEKSEFPNEGIQTPWHDIRFFEVKNDKLILVKALHLYKMFVDEKKN